jgi:hypothetical protein
MAHMWEQVDSSARLTDDVLPPQTISLEDAQSHTNFVVFAPEWLPDDCRVTQHSLRPEQPPGRPAGVEAGQYGLTPWSVANPCSTRSVIEGDSRRLRIKQFLYDWCVPAASTAPLWNSPQLESFRCQDAIGWIGTDYQKRHGACVQLARTQIEISVEAGAFTDDELQRMLRALRPANPSAAQAVRAAPFHQLNYFVRYKVMGPDVPYGMWRYRAARRYAYCRRAALDDLKAAAPVPFPMMHDPAYEFDSAVIIEYPADHHREVEIVYRSVQNHSDYVWIAAMNADSAIALPIPPKPDDHPAETRGPVSLRGTTVYYAALTEDYGAWEAFWQDGSTRIAVWASASPYLTGETFRHLIEALDIHS